MKILLDTNIILDFALERKDFVENSKSIMKLAYKKQIEAYISASSATDIYYIIQKNKSKEEALFFLSNIISFIEIAGVDKNVVLNAIQSTFSDFEDAVQNFAAQSSGIEFIVTRNNKDFVKSDLKILNPNEFLDFVNDNSGK